MNNKVNRAPKAWEAYPPQIDRVEMAGRYSASATSVRAFLLERLQELGEAPYISWRGILCCSLSNPQGTHALKITQRGSSVWIRGSLSKWSGCVDEYARPYLPSSKVDAIIQEVLDRLELDAKWVKVHSVEIGLDIVVAGKIGDYTPYLRTAKGQRRKLVDRGYSTHYQGNTRREFKVYDKGEEQGMQLPEGVTLLRMELTLQNGASSIRKALGLGLPLHASDFGKTSMMHSLVNALFKMIDEVLPTGVPRATGALKDVELETAIGLLVEVYGDEWLPRLMERMEELARAYPDRRVRQRLRAKAKGLRDRYSKLDAERFMMLRDAIERVKEAG